MPTCRYYLALDLGTTCLKTAAFPAAAFPAAGDDTPRAAVVQSETRLPMVRGAECGSDRREQSLEDLRAILIESLAKTAKRLGADAAHVVGISLASQGGSGAIVRAKDGAPRTSLFLWNDSRAFARLSEVAGRRAAGFWRERTERDAPGQGLGRLLWLREKDPGLFSEGHLHVGVGEYAFFVMTGAWRQDSGSAVQNGCYNAREDALDKEQLETVGVRTSLVAPLRKGHGTLPLSEGLARLAGLPAGIPVAGPYLDQEAGYMSVAAEPGPAMQMSLGTAWVGNFTLSAGERWRSPFQLVLPAPDHEARRLVVQPLLTGNVTWDWAMERFVDTDSARARARACELLAERPLPPEGLAALPWLNWANPMSASAHGAGALFGISPQTGGDDLLRAVAAGMVCEAARVLRRVIDGGRVRSVVLTGGAARCEAFGRLFAAFLHPVEIRIATEPGTAGLRGALYPFDPSLARLATRAVSPATASDLEQSARFAALYERLYERLYGSEPAGAAFALEGEMG